MNIIKILLDIYNSLKIYRILYESFKKMVRKEILYKKYLILNIYIFFILKIKILYYGIYFY